MSMSTTLRVAFDAKRVQRGLAGIKSGFDSIKKAGMAIAKVSAVFLGLAAAASAAVLKINSIGEDAKTSEARLKNIVKAMGLFGDQSDEVAERLNNLADTQARLIGQDNKTIRLTQSKLLTFKELALTANVVGGVFDRATQAALDLAATGFGTAESNAVQLGKALNDPIKGLTSLSKSGVSFTESEKARIRVLAESNRMGEAQNEILKAIEGQVKDTARATADGSKIIIESASQLLQAFSKPFSDGFNAIPGMLENIFPQLKAKAESAGRLIGTGISEAVNGDFERLKAIGKFIGDVLAAATRAAYQTGIVNLNRGVMKFLEDINPVRRGLEAVGIDADRGSDYGKDASDFGSAFDAELISRGINRPVVEMFQGLPEPKAETPPPPERTVLPPSASSSLTEEAKMMRVLAQYAKETATNTRGGAKM